MQLCCEHDSCDPTSNLGADNPPLSWEKALTLLDTIPGVGQQTAELLLAEIGSESLS